jgi:ribosomal protein S18 acetylase RimI-like enzyme
MRNTFDARGGTTVVSLVPMSAEVFGRYADAAAAGYADDMVSSGRWPADGALARGLADFRHSLPQGLDTPDNYLFEIQDQDSGASVGVLCFSIQKKGGFRSAFVFDIEVKPEFRRRGYATAALEELERFVRGMGLSGITLHVFGHNEAAQRLYRKSGYDVTGVNMLKHLG